MTSADRSSTDHAAHDIFVVAAFAAGDLEARDLPRAQLQVAGCQDCADLRDELVAIAAATSRLPAPTRSREFTLNADDAARLRRPSLRRMLVDLAGPRGLIGRPIAAAVTSLGVAGIVLASAGGMIGNFGDAGAAPAAAEYAPGDGPSRAVESPAPQGLGSESSAPIPPGDTSGVGGLGSQEPGSAQGPEAAPTPGASPDSQGLKNATDGEAGPATSPLVAISIALLALGLGLFALRRVAARLV